MYDWWACERQKCHEANILSDRLAFLYLSLKNKDVHTRLYTVWHMFSVWQNKSIEEIFTKLKTSKQLNISNLLSLKDFYYLF